MTKEQTGWRPLASNRRLKAVLGEYYAELDEAARTGSRRVAWCSSQGPVELLRAMGFLIYFPENHGAILGATRQAGDFIPRAVAEGFSPEVCSYLTSDIGAFLCGQTPLQAAYGLAAPPRPEVLVYNNNQCREVQEWFGFYARRFGVPLLGIRTPRGVGPLSPEIIQSVVRQMETLAADLASLASRPLDLGEFRRLVALSAQTSQLWSQILDLARNRPSPLSFFEASLHIGPAVVLRGTEAANLYYRGLLAELTGRVAAGEGAVPRERFRLFWEGMPIWGRLRFLAQTLAGLQACVVASTYGQSWVFEDFDPEEPFQSTARAYTRLFTVRDEPAKEEFLARMIDRFQIDGLIFHDSRTCANCSNSRYGLPQRLSRRTGLPFLVLEGDLNDLRCFSQEQSLTQLEALAETLAQKAAAAPRPGVWGQPAARLRRAQSSRSAEPSPQPASRGGPSLPS